MALRSCFCRKAKGSFKGTKQLIKALKDSYRRHSNNESSLKNDWNA